MWKHLDAPYNVEKSVEKTRNEEEKEEEDRETKGTRIAKKKRTKLARNYALPARTVGERGRRERKEREDRKREKRKTSPAVSLPVPDVHAPEKNSPENSFPPLLFLLAKLRREFLTGLRASCRGG